ncbi:hypothetical protein V8C34DRAFT_267425 [Trichoderma compactum]
MKQACFVWSRKDTRWVEGIGFYYGKLFDFICILVGFLFSIVLFDFDVLIEVSLPLYQTMSKFYILYLIIWRVPE